MPQHAAACQVCQGTGTYADNSCIVVGIRGDAATPSRIKSSHVCPNPKSATILTEPRMIHAIHGIHPMVGSMFSNMDGSKPGTTSLTDHLLIWVDSTCLITKPVTTRVPGYQDHAFPVSVGAAEWRHSDGQSAPGNGSKG
jgi:hypothetical protein